MNGIDLNRGAEAALTAIGPDNAKAASPAFPVSTNEETAPDGRSGAIDIDGADLLDRVRDYARRFICYPSETACIGHVVWVAHTHLMDAWFSTPRLAVLSPEPGSGKSRVLEITALLVPNPAYLANSSASYILRKVADQDNRPTILYDEADTTFGPNARGNEDLRGMINAGYRRGATVGRCFTEKGKVHTQDLPTYAAAAVCGLGDLPDTIMSRSVIMRMRRRGQGEKVEPFQPHLHEQPAGILHDELAAWAASVSGLAKIAQPLLPDGIVDRRADVWGPLLTVAELAGGRWPDLARQAAIEAVQSARVNERPSLHVQLLADIRTCFGGKDKLSTADLLAKLLADEEAPWGDMRGRKIDPRKLGELLRPYGIQSSNIRMADGTTPKGYRREAFHDTWKRYLPAPKPDATSATDATSQEIRNKTVTYSVTNKAEPPSCGGTDEDVAKPGS